MMKDPEFTDYGDIIITEENDPDEIINQIMGKYNKIERGIGVGFSAQFISKAMFSGFYLTASNDPELLPNEYNQPTPSQSSQTSLRRGIVGSDRYGFYAGSIPPQTNPLAGSKPPQRLLRRKAGSWVLNPLANKENIICYPLYNIWKTQTVLFFDRLHESKSVMKLLKNYELKINLNLERIIDKCIKAHGDIWVLPLKKTLLDINKNKYNDVDILSFELYKNNKLKAGEFGVKTGKIYTSYSGFYNENSAGSVQLLMMLRYLRDKNFILCNFGTDDSEKNNAYKRRLGSEYIDRELFIKLWREARML